jgi:glycerol-3-phosphate acyltransferase PlsY
MKVVLLMIFAYVIGSIPTGVIIGERYFNIDIREYGSKNIGGTNAGRVLGKKAGFIVSAIDILKVFIPAQIAAIYLNADSAAIVGLAGLLGHCYPLFSKFKGGKGVSSYFGIVFALNFYLGIATLVIWKLLKHLLNYVSLASIFACFAATFIYLYLYGLSISFYILFAGAFFIVYLHRANIKRLINGTENKVNTKR